MSTQLLWRRAFVRYLICGRKFAWTLERARKAAMGRCGQLVIGPAGSGKSTYCELMRNHIETLNRRVHVVNLDPAAEHFRYPVAADIRDLISLEDVMTEMKLGPNGGLIYCMEYLIDNIDWLQARPPAHAAGTTAPLRTTQPRSAPARQQPRRNSSAAAPQQRHSSSCATLPLAARPAGCARRPRGRRVRALRLPGPD